MRILITGGAGCLGSNLIEHWLPQGHEILVIDNFATGKKEVLSGVEGVTVVEGDISNKAVVDECFDKFNPTHVIHSAASYKDPEAWEEDTRTNVLGTINIAKASRRHEVERVVYFQTALCYGRPEEVPIPVDHPARPFTSYGISKTAGENYLMAAADLPVVSLRLANICGPRLAIGPIPTFYKRLKAGQECFCSDAVRDFMDMSDFLELMDRIVCEETPRGVYNISTGEGHSIKEVFDQVASYLHLENEVEAPVVPVGEDDIQAVVLDPSKTEEILNWKAKVSFRETIRRQLEWYDRHGVNDIYSHLSRPAK